MAVGVAAPHLQRNEDNGSTLLCFCDVTSHPSQKWFIKRIKARGDVGTQTQ